MERTTDIKCPACGEPLSSNDDCQTCLSARPPECPDGGHPLGDGPDDCSTCNKYRTFKEEQAKQWPGNGPPDVGPEVLEEVYVGITTGTIFTDRDLPPDPASMRMVFMPMGLAHPPPLVYAVEIGLIWEHLHKAGPRSVNGMPVFFSMNLMNKKDFAKIQPRLKAYFERQQQDRDALRDELQGGGDGG